MSKVKFRVIASGSNGNAAYFSTPDGTLLIDAGISRKRILYALQEDNIQPEEVKGILITHAHTDHSRGLPILTKYVEAPLYITRGTKRSLADLGRRNRVWFDISENSFVLNFKEKFYGDFFEVLPIPTDHDAIGSSGFQISYEGFKVTTLTDLGKYTPQQIELIRESDIALLEMNHNLELLEFSNRPIWLKNRIKKAHVSNTQTMDLIQTLAGHDNSNLKAIIAAHLSGECNSPRHVASTIGEVQKRFDKDDLSWDWYIARRDVSGKAFEYDLKDRMCKTGMEPADLSDLSFIREFRRDMRKLRKETANLKNFFPLNT